MRIVAAGAIVANDLAAVDRPAVVDPRRRRRRPGEVLRRRLADRGGEHDVGRDDGPEAVRHRRRLALLTAGDGDAPRPHHVDQHGEVHVDADRRGRIAPGQPGRRHQHVVDGRHAAAAELARDRRDRGSRRRGASRDARRRTCRRGRGPWRRRRSRRRTGSPRPPSRRRRRCRRGAPSPTPTTRAWWWSSAHHRGCSAMMPSTALPTISWVMASLPGWKPPQRTSR